jgi:hypothetical protein
VRFDAVLHEARVDAEFVLGVVQDLVDADDQRLVGLVRDRPRAQTVVVDLDDQAARRAHPVQRLVGAVVGVDGHRAIGLDQDEPGSRRKVG